MRPGGAERDAELVRQLTQLGSALGDPRHDFSEGLAPPGPDLDLRCDQLADEIRLELGALRGCFEVLETVRERQGLGVEDRELLLDGDREVLRRLVLVIGLLEQVLRHVERLRERL